MATGRRPRGVSCRALSQRGQPTRVACTCHFAGFPESGWGRGRCGEALRRADPQRPGPGWTRSARGGDGSRPRSGRHRIGQGAAAKTPRRPRTRRTDHRPGRRQNRGSSTFKGTAAELSAKQAQFQPQLDAILGQATVVDEELAQAIEMADGDVPIPHGTPTIDRVGPDGLTPAQVAIDAGQEKNQQDAFRQVYGRDPLSANDWRRPRASIRTPTTPDTAGTNPRLWSEDSPRYPAAGSIGRTCTYPRPRSRTSNSTTG